MADISLTASMRCQAGNSLSYAGLTGETIKNVWIRWYFFGLPYFAG